MQFRCLGINHFDRAGTCGTTAAPKPVNWEISVPNGVYTAKVDFGENHYSQGCETEGLLCHSEMGGTGDAGTGCVFDGTVRVEDGRFTVTGYSHDTGLCHSISAVEIKGGGGAAGPIEARTCEGSVLSIACDEDVTIMNDMVEGLVYITASWLLSNPLPLPAVSGYIALLGATPAIAFAEAD